MKKEFRLQQLPDIAQELISKAVSLSSSQATILAFSGELGAGKTTLTQEIGTQLGIKENMISPTFVIMKKYKTTHATFKHLVHIDAYRLNSSSELLRLGWDDIASSAETLVILEWPERVPECLIGKTVLPVSLSHIGHIDEETRQIEF